MTKYLEDLKTGCKWIHSIVTDTVEVRNLNGNLVYTLDGIDLHRHRHRILTFDDNDIFHKTYYYEYRIVESNFDILEREGLIDCYLKSRIEWYNTRIEECYVYYKECESNLLKQYFVHPEILGKMFIKTIDKNSNL